MGCEKIKVILHAKRTITEEHIKQLQREGKEGIRHTDPLDWIAFTVLIAVMVGVAYTIYMNKIYEKEIATGFQKNMSFGLVVFAGLAGGMIGGIQAFIYSAAPKALIWMAAGGFLNFVAGLPIYLSFRKGIVYGVQ